MEIQGKMLNLVTIAYFVIRKGKKI